jgi:inorganic pyrophosphatase
LTAVAFDGFEWRDRLQLLQPERVLARTSGRVLARRGLPAAVRWPAAAAHPVRARPSAGPKPGSCRPRSMPVKSAKSEKSRATKRGRSDPRGLPARDDEGHLHVVVETPRGSTLKIAWDPKLRAFAYGRALTAGLSFPFDFGFVPSTMAADGDPIDALVLHDGATFPGVFIACKLLGVIRVEQREDGKRIRNDRLVAVPAEDARVGAGFAGRALSARRKAELEEFFRFSTLFEGKGVTILGWGGPQEAERLIDAHMRPQRRSK